jgi:hypothetical protein
MSNWNLTLVNSFAENLKSYKTSFSKMKISLQEKQRNTLFLKNYGISVKIKKLLQFSLKNDYFSFAYNKKCVIYK